MDDFLAELVIEHFDLDTAIASHNRLIELITERLSLDPLIEQIDQIASDLNASLP